MKNTLQYLLCALVLCAPVPFAFSQVTDSFTKDLIVSEIQKAQSPVVNGDYIVFTADKKARYAGIVFDFENYKNIHAFERLVMRDGDGKTVDSVLFYILQIPQDAQRISYKLVIDGLWTHDPLNPDSSYEQSLNSIVSGVQVNRPVKEVSAGLPSGTARFVYKGQSGLQIRLAGTFNNWDSYMYTLPEVRPGIYQLDLPLPAGSYYYVFYTGTKRLLDEANPQKVYTRDGTAASVITVQ